MQKMSINTIVIYNFGDSSIYSNIRNNKKYNILLQVKRWQEMRVSRPLKMKLRCIIISVCQIGDIKKIMIFW